MPAEHVINNYFINSNFITKISLNKVAICSKISILANPLPSFDGAVLYDPNQFLQLNPSPGSSFTVNWNTGLTQIGNFQVQIAVLGYPMPWNASAANQVRMRSYPLCCTFHEYYLLMQLYSYVFRIWRNSEIGRQLPPRRFKFLCRLAKSPIVRTILLDILQCVSLQDRMWISKSYSRFGNYSKANFLNTNISNCSFILKFSSSPYVELRSLPVMLGWHQQSGVGNKQTWLNGQCQTWINTLGNQRLRDLVANQSGFQCPCTLDRALADAGFGYADPACTSTYCQYGNYSADITCLMSYGLRYSNTSCFNTDWCLL